MRGEISWWWLKEYNVAYQKWGFWEGALISYFYFAFYSAAVPVIWVTWKWYNARNFYPSTDRFYSEVPREHISLYQHYFTKVINSIDVDTETNWSMSKPYNKEQFKKDEAVMEEIIVSEAAAEGLSPAIFQVIVHQYFFADVYQREMDKSHWVQRVMRLKEPDYNLVLSDA